MFVSVWVCLCMCVFRAKGSETYRFLTGDCDDFDLFQSGGALLYPSEPYWHFPVCPQVDSIPISGQPSVGSDPCLVGPMLIPMEGRRRVVLSIGSGPFFPKTQLRPTLSSKCTHGKPVFHCTVTDDRHKACMQCLVCNIWILAGRDCRISTR